MLAVLCFFNIFLLWSTASQAQAHSSKAYSYYARDCNFPIYWNAPSFTCGKYGLNFTERIKHFGIVANSQDSFRGSKVNILYDPGAYPAVLKSNKGRVVERNGGIPQLGNITYHLEALKNVINQLIPTDYSGIGIIDFEAWRPIFRQNYGDQKTYTNMSRDLVRQKHPQYDEKKVETEARHQFEKSSKIFLESSLKLVRHLRPGGRWGYYGYPYCFNYRSNTGMQSACSKTVQKENNQIQWLFDNSDALYPSLYMGQKPAIDAKGYVTGRMNEAVRVSSRAKQPPQINPYMWYKYFDSLEFLSENDFYVAMDTVRRYKAGGYVLWGSSNDFSSKDKCQSVLSYLERVIGPTVQKLRASCHPSTLYDDGRRTEVASINGDKITLNPMNNQMNVQHDAVAPGQQEQNPVYQVPNVLIFSAVNENGTSKTIYRYEPPSDSSKFHYITLPPPTDPPKPSSVAQSSTTAGANRSARSEFSDVPLLKEYMKGFEQVLNNIMKRWLRGR